MDWLMILEAILIGFVGFLYAEISPLMTLFYFMFLYIAGLRDYPLLSEAFLLGAAIGALIHSALAEDKKCECICGK